MERSLLSTESTSLLAPDCLIRLFACWAMLVNASRAPALMPTDRVPK